MSDAAVGDYAYEDSECPLCMEEIDVTDKYFRPCPCDYQVCLSLCPWKERLLNKCMALDLSFLLESYQGRLE